MTMNREELETLCRLMNWAKSIKMLYQKLYDLEIANKKDTDEYRSLLCTLNDAIEFESKEYIKIKHDKNLVDNLLQFIGSVPLQSNTIFDKNIIAARIESRLIEATYDLEYERDYYSEEEISAIEKNTSFEVFLYEQIMPRYEQYMALRHIHCGVLDSLAKLTSKKEFKTNGIIMEKYSSGYVKSYIELALVTTNFSPATYQLFDIGGITNLSEQVAEIENEIIDKQIDKVFMLLISKKQNKDVYIANLSIFNYMIGKLALEKLIDKYEFYVSIITDLNNNTKYSKNKCESMKKLLRKHINKQLKINETSKVMIKRY